MKEKIDIIIILVLGCNSEPYKSLIKASKETWFLQKNEKIKTFFYYGGNESFKIANEDILCKSPEIYSKINLKTIETLKYAVENFNFKYIFRINAGSFIHYNNLIKFLNNKPLKEFYSGIIGNHEGLRYVIYRYATVKW